MYEIETPDLEGEIGRHRELFDLSNYPSNHLLRDDTNKKVVLKFKNETAGNTLKFITILHHEQSLLYSLIFFLTHLIFFQLNFFKGVPVRQFVGLRPKIYSLLLAVEKRKRRPREFRNPLSKIS